MWSGLGWPSRCGQKGRGTTPNEWKKMCLINSKSLIFCQFSINKLFTLNSIIYVWFHAIHFELFYKSTNLEIDSINKFVLYNTEAMQPWVMLYVEERRKWSSKKKSFKQLNGRSMHYHDHLKENMPKICPNSWVAEKYKRNMKCSIVTHVERIWM